MRARRRLADVLVSSRERDAASVERVVSRRSASLRRTQQRSRPDDAALARVVASRALSASQGVPSVERGARYVVNGETYVVHRVTATSVVLRKPGTCAFLMSDVSGSFDPANWRY